MYIERHPISCYFSKGVQGSLTKQGVMFCGLIRLLGKFRHLFILGKLVCTYAYVCVCACGCVHVDVDACGCVVCTD